MPSPPSLYLLGQWVLAAGLLLLALGIGLLLGDRLGLGKLPGDLHWQGKGGSVYFPLTTCLVLSVLVSVVLSLWWSRR